MSGDLTRKEIERLNSLPCKCVHCADCRGTGNIRVNPWTGHYQDYMDDMYDLEPCDSCHGGIIETCERCLEMEELYQLLEDEQEFSKP